MQVRNHKGALLLWLGVLAIVAIIAPSSFTQENFPVEKPLIGDYPEKGVYVHHLGTRWFDPINIGDITEEFTVINPLDETISLTIGSKSCSCVATDFSGVDLRPNESVPVKLTLTPATYSTSRHEAIILKTGNQALPDISLEIYAETIPYYSIKLLDHSIYDMCDGDERTIPVVAKVYTPDKDETSINLRCDDDYLTIRQDAPEVRKYSEELYEITVTGEITIRCDLTKVKPPITHNSIRLEYLGETRYRADVIWCPKSSCSVSRENLFFNTARLIPQTIEIETENPSSLTKLFCKDDFIELTGEIDEVASSHTVTAVLLPEKLPEGKRGNTESEIEIYLDNAERPTAVVPVRIYIPRTSVK
ncbi:MAG: hypothetical protein ACOX6D_09050 [Thermoguttaceae bacterium]|jgi:hypothetical protein